MSNLRSGIYKHYKGPRYLVLEVAKHSETDEELVVYRCLYGKYDLWVRPLELFTESVIVNDEPVARFEYVGEMTDDELVELDKKIKIESV